MNNKAESHATSKNKLKRSLFLIAGLILIFLSMSQNIKQLFSKRNTPTGTTSQQEINK